VVHSIVPLAVLEAVRNLDTPVEDGLTEFAEELLSKRLGLSATVTSQLAQYEALVRRDAGRRVARRAVKRLFFMSRAAASLSPRVLGFRVARSAARAVLGGELRREGHIPVVGVRDTFAVNATPDGTACTLYASGFSELLRLLIGFEGAMVHASCRAAGADRCEWRAAAPDPRHQ